MIELRRTGDGYEVAVRFDWYRALPLSCFSVALSVDGEAVPEDRIRLHLNDRDYALDALPYDEFWFVLDAGRLRVAAPLADGAHDVAVDLTLRIPYLFDEETGDVLTLHNQPRARLEL